MKAIYKGRLCVVAGDHYHSVELSPVDEDRRLLVRYDDPELIIDPTDSQIEELTNNED